MTSQTHNTNPVKTKTRRWFRFRLRSLLVMVTLLSVPLGWVGWELDQRRREKPAIAWVEKMGGQVYFNSGNRNILFIGFFSDERSWWEKTKDKWLGDRVQFADLRGTKVSDLSLLAELKKLRGLDLQNTQVSDLSPLDELMNLEKLELFNTQVSDLSPLAELKKLKELHLNTTPVNDLFPLAELKNLKCLVLSNTPVNDLSPLAAMKNLELLYLFRTVYVRKEQLQDLRLALPNCDIRSNNHYD